MNNEPLVSVVLTVYNRPIVRGAIKSILEQTYENFEFIIVDNASTDNTVDVIKSFNDDRIKLYVNDKNYGQTYSLNRGLKLAQGKYIARLDSDDISLPKRLEKEVDFLEKHPDYVFCGTWIQLISDDDRLGIIRRFPITNEGFRTCQYLACAAIHPTIMMRKEILEKYKIEYDPNIVIAEDYDMWRRLLLYGKGANIGEVLCYFRNGKHNDNKKYSAINKQETLEVRRKILAELPKENKDKIPLSKVLQIEEKDKKSIRDILKLYKYYKILLHNNIGRKSSDYSIVKNTYLLQYYFQCFSKNKAWYAAFVRLLYNGLKRIRSFIKK